MAAKDLEKLNLNDTDPGIPPPPPGQSGGFAFASAPAGAPKEGFSFNMPPAPPAAEPAAEPAADGALERQSCLTSHGLVNQLPSVTV